MRGRTSEVEIRTDRTAGLTYEEKTLGLEWTSDKAKVNNSAERGRPASTKEAVFIEIVIEAKVDAEADFGGQDLLSNPESPFSPVVLKTAVKCQSMLKTSLEGPSANIGRKRKI